MKTKFKTELIIFIVIFLFLSIGMHFKEFSSYPLRHILALPYSGAYGFGAFHPFIFTFAIYVLFIPIRGITKLFIQKNSL